MIKGKAHRYGDNIDTDVIIPARYLNTSDHAELAKHCMEDLDPEFTKKIAKGDIIVGGYNFGCGSSREHAPIAIRASGISMVIAKSFARIFYRNAINTGLPIIESPEAVEGIQDGDEISVNLETGEIHNISQGVSYQGLPFPDFIKGIIKTGGLLNYLKEEKKNEL